MTNSVTADRVLCRVCHRPLRNLISIAEGVGPVCRKKVRAALTEMLDRVARGEAEADYENAYASSPEELENLIVNDVRNAYLNLGRRPTRQPVTVEVPSRTRIVEHEPITVSWIDGRRAEVSSASGNQYQTTEESCTCPDFIYRRARNPELAQEGCRHMQALRLAREEVREQRRLARQSTRTTIPDPVEIHSQNRETFAQIDWTEEEQRERVLNIWKENRPFSGVHMSQDDEAWRELKAKSQRELDYKYENVLGGTGNSFGVELEVEFNSRQERDAAMRELYESGITSSPNQASYHSGNRHPGKWISERDGSLGSYGIEFVSPVLRDSPETWQQLEKVTEILKRNGAKVSSNCGGHIHLGIAPLDHRTYSWQRLARIGVAYERQFYRMGGADSESYRRNGTPGKHRGNGYAGNFGNVSFSGQISAEVARRRISSNRKIIFNATNVDASGSSRKPTVEMRYPNGTLDHRQIQAQVMVANAMVHQAAVIRNGSPESQYTPRFSETDKQLRLNQSSTSEQEEKNFRSLLDVIGNNQDRHAATWLWLRGRCR